MSVHPLSAASSHQATPGPSAIPRYRMLHCNDMGEDYMSRCWIEAECQSPSGTIKRAGDLEWVSAGDYEREQMKAERVFQAVVYAFEGREVPADLLDHGMVRRALKFRASGAAAEGRS